MRPTTDGAIGQMAGQIQITSPWDSASTRAPLTRVCGIFRGRTLVTSLSNASMRAALALGTVDGGRVPNYRVDHIYPIDYCHLTNPQRERPTKWATKASLPHGHTKKRRPLQ
jgi:hypothetical protein